MRLHRSFLGAVLASLALAGPGPARQAPARWQLADRPAITIGREGDPHTEFLRIGRVVRLPDGAIAVPNGGSNEIRIFDRTGRYLRTLGRAGGGPGELRSLNLLDHAGDTLIVGDGVNQRITLFTAAGTLVKTIPITARDSTGRFSVVGRLRSGRWAVVTLSTPNLYGPERTYRDTSWVGTIAPDASGAVSWNGTFPGLTFFVHNPANGPHGDVVGVVPLAPRSVSAVSGDEVLIGDTGDSVIGAYASTGGILRLIHLPLAALPLTEDRIARLRQQALELNPAERGRPYLTALHSRAVMGRTLPVFSAILAAADGSIWVEEGATDRAEPATWLVLDSREQPKARLQVPPGFRITDAGPGYVLGVHTDADGVETVRLYRVTP